MDGRSKYIGEGKEGGGTIRLGTKEKRNRIVSNRTCCLSVRDRACIRRVRLREVAPMWSMGTGSVEKARESARDDV